MCRTLRRVRSHGSDSAIDLLIGEPRLTEIRFSSRTERGEVSIECSRIFADGNGESHFGTMSIELSDANFAPPAPPLEVSELVKAQHGFLRAPGGWYGDWHPTPRRQVMCLLSGSLQVGVSDGETRLLERGAILVLEDTTGRGHTTRVPSTEPAILMFAQFE